MKPLLIAIGLVVSVGAFSQKYAVGLEKKGSSVKNVEGQIIVADSTVTSIFNGQTTVYKITKRNGFTIHVANGETEGKYVISHHAGRQYGFSYERLIHFHEKHHSSTPTSVFLCSIKKE